MGSLGINVDQLKASLSKSAAVVTTESSAEEYQQSIKRWATNSEKPARIVIYPATVEDVSKAVLFGVASKLEVVTVGGRHSAGGTSSREGGICIDLGKMRNVTVDTEKKTATAQGGCRWIDVDSELAKFGLATVGGTVNDTGIGGLTLGGGYGWLTGTYGLVIDNLIEVEVVLVDGSVVKAAEFENSDLFWGIRGAGINFGIVTSFTYQAYEQGPVWAGQLVFTKEQIIPVFHIANHLLATSNGRSTMFTAFAAPPPAHQPVVLVVVFFNGSEEEGNDFFEPLISLGPLVNTTASMPYENVNTLVGQALEPGFRRLMKGSSTIHPLDPELAEELARDYEEFITRFPDANLTMVLFEYYPVMKIMDVPQTATAFANRGTTVGLTFIPGWTKEEFDIPCRDWAREMSKKTKDYRLKSLEYTKVDENTQVCVGEYSNHDGLGDGPEVIYGLNYPRLVELKKKFDPENFFGNGRNSIIKKPR